MKRIVALIMVLALVIALAACGGSGNSGSQATGGSDKPAASADDTAKATDEPAATTGDVKYKAVFCSAMNNESQSFTRKMLEQHMGEYGIQVDVLDDAGVAATQADNIAQAVSMGYDWIIVNPTDATAVGTSLKAAKEANPDIVISTLSADVSDEVDKDVRNFFVGVDDISAGQTAADFFFEKFPDGANLVEIGGQAGHLAQINRNKGFMLAMESHPEFTILDSQNCKQWQTDMAQTIAEDFVTKYGNKIQGIFCHWDNGATGVITALAGAGLSDVVIVGVDGNRAGYDQVKEGKGSYVSIAQDFEQIAITSMESFLKLKDGGSVDSVIYVPLQTWTYDKIDSVTPPEW